jgi:hypothetical protein
MFPPMIKTGAKNSVVQTFAKLQNITHRVTESAPTEKKPIEVFQGAFGNGITKYIKSRNAVVLGKGINYKPVVPAPRIKYKTSFL